MPLIEQEQGTGLAESGGVAEAEKNQRKAMTL